MYRYEYPKSNQIRKDSFSDFLKKEDEWITVETQNPNPKKKHFPNQVNKSNNSKEYIQPEINYYKWPVAFEPNFEVRNDSHKPTGTKVKKNMIRTDLRMHSQEMNCEYLKAKTTAYLSKHKLLITCDLNRNAPNFIHFWRMKFSHFDKFTYEPLLDIRTKTHASFCCVNESQGLIAIGFSNRSLYLFHISERANQKIDWEKKEFKGVVFSLPDKHDILNIDKYPPHYKTPRRVKFWRYLKKNHKMGHSKDKRSKDGPKQSDEGSSFSNMKIPKVEDEKFLGQLNRVFEDDLESLPVIDCLWERNHSFHFRSLEIATFDTRRFPERCLNRMPVSNNYDTRIREFKARVPGYDITYCTIH